MSADYPLMLTPEQLSERLGVAVATLARRRVSGIDSPPFVRIGSRVFYPMADLEAWLASLPRSRSTSDNPPGKRRPRAGRRRHTESVP